MDKGRLKAIPLFENLDDHDLQVIATFANEMSVSEGEVLVREGDFSYELMAIEEGTAEVREAPGLGRLAEGRRLLRGGRLAAQRAAQRDDRRHLPHARDHAVHLGAASRMRKMPGVMDKIYEIIASRG